MIISNCGHWVCAALWDRRCLGEICLIGGWQGRGGAGDPAAPVWRVCGQLRGGGKKRAGVTKGPERLGGGRVHPARAQRKRFGGFCRYFSIRKKLVIKCEANSFNSGLLRSLPSPRNVQVPAHRTYVYAYPHVHTSRSSHTNQDNRRFPPKPFQTKSTMFCVGLCEGRAKRGYIFLGRPFSALPCGGVSYDHI